MNDMKGDATDDSMVEELRGVLLPVEPLPLGLRSRWEARIQEAARETPQGSVAVTVTALAAFVGGCAIAGPDVFLNGMWPAVLGGAAVYSFGVRLLLR